MKNKKSKKSNNLKIYPKAVWWFIFLAIIYIFLASFLAGIIYSSIVLPIDNPLKYILIIVGIPLIVYLTASVIVDSLNKIVFGEESLFIFYKSLVRKSQNVQHDVEVKYSEIEDIYFIMSQDDSLGRSRRTGIIIPASIPYIVFVSKGQQNRIAVSCYRKKQKIQIFEEAKKRAEAAGNHLEIGSGEELWKKCCEENKFKI